MKGDDIADAARRWTYYRYQFINGLVVCYAIRLQNGYYIIVTALVTGDVDAR